MLDEDNKYLLVRNDVFIKIFGQFSLTVVHQSIHEGVKLYRKSLDKSRDMKNHRCFKRHEAGP